MSVPPFDPSGTYMIPGPVVVLADADLMTDTTALRRIERLGYPLQNPLDPPLSPCKVVFPGTTEQTICSDVS
jgi:hypothetical protein